MARYWLMKSEPSVFSIDDLAAAKEQTTRWDELVQAINRVLRPATE